MSDAVDIYRFDCPLCPHRVFASRSVGCPFCGNVEPDAMERVARVGVVSTEVE